MSEFGNEYIATMPGTAHINEPKCFTSLNNNFWTLNIDCQSLFTRFSSFLIKMWIVQIV